MFQRYFLIQKHRRIIRRRDCHRKLRSGKSNMIGGKYFGQSLMIKNNVISLTLCRKNIYRAWKEKWQISIPFYSTRPLFKLNLFPKTFDTVRLLFQVFHDQFGQSLDGLLDLLSPLPRGWATRWRRRILKGQLTIFFVFGFFSSNNVFWSQQACLETITNFSNIRGVVRIRNWLHWGVKENPIGKAIFSNINHMSLSTLRDSRLIQL